MKTKKIKINQKTKLKVVQDYQYKYYDPRHKIVEFDVRKSIFLKVGFIKDTARFSQGSKLSPKYIRTFENNWEN